MARGEPPTLEARLFDAEERASAALLGLVRDPAVRLVTWIGPAGDCVEYVGKPSAGLIARVRVLVSAAGALAFGATLGRPSVVATACEGGNVVVGTRGDGVGMVVLVAEGSSFGLTLTRVRHALGLDGGNDLRKVRSLP